jgi:3'-phosphoadenosine 5'-phosphosulfate sulfotransferase (PAPS reductase)/FAD synthetase
MSKLEQSERIFTEAIRRFEPTHIVSMVSGGKDSATSHAVAEELDIKLDLIIHGKTGCGIPETTDFVEKHYGKLSADFAIADAGTAYEEYVLRKGFFGKGIAAHGFSYRVLKATPFRKAISKHIRKRRRDIRILLINGARKDESPNRRKHLEVFRQDPAAKGNIWVNLIHDWSALDRAEYLESRGVPINPVSREICRSGECMCGTMQTQAERIEAAAFYPEWGDWLNDLEAKAKKLHGFGWGETFPRTRQTGQLDLFQPMCIGCTRDA